MDAVLFHFVTLKRDRIIQLCIIVNLLVVRYFTSIKKMLLVELLENVKLKQNYYKQNKNITKRL